MKTKMDDLEVGWAASSGQIIIITHSTLLNPVKEKV